ncbi:hypothetical protein GX48_06501 [Paracoccidioides brasiliensis]|nr:hypothetical protein GX48_06501 [Paracoccidioides brasiliensis]
MPGVLLKQGYSQCWFIATGGRKESSARRVNHRILYRALQFLSILFEIQKAASAGFEVLSLSIRDLYMVWLFGTLTLIAEGGCFAGCYDKSKNIYTSINPETETRFNHSDSEVYVLSFLDHEDNNQRSALFREATEG